MRAFHCWALALLARAVQVSCASNATSTRTVDQTTTVRLISTATVRSTVTEAPNATSVSSIGEAGLYVASYSWARQSGATASTVGTVLVVVNQSQNRTYTTTKYNTEYYSNTTLVSRTDTNSAGTVTATVNYRSSTLTVTYPTNALVPKDYITFYALLPSNYQNESCCAPQTTSSATPAAHAALRTPAGSMDKNDPKGYLYGLRAADSTLASQPLSSYFLGKDLEAFYTGCPHAICASTSSRILVSPQGQDAPQQLRLLETSTMTISSIDSTQAPETSTSASPSQTATPPVQSPTALPDSLPPSSPASSPAPGPSTVAEAPPSPSAQQPTPPEQQSSPSQQQPAPSQQQPSQPQQGSSPPQQASPPPQQESQPPQQASPQPSPGSPDNASPTAGSPAQQAPASTPAGVIISQGSQDASQPFVPAFTQGAAPEAASSAAPVAGGENSEVAGGSQQSVQLHAFTFGSSVVTANSASQFVVAGQTVAPGSAAVISGSTVTAPTPTPVPHAAGGSQQAAPLAPLTIGSTVVTANSASQYVVGGQTLRPGSPAVFSGTTYTVPASLLAGAQGSAPSMGGYIMGGLGQSAGSSPGQSAAPGSGSSRSASPSRPTGAVASGTGSRGLASPSQALYQGSASQLLSRVSLTVCALSIICFVFGAMI